MVDKDSKILMGRIFGILSIIFAFISSWGIGGMVLGIIGLSQLKDEKKSCKKERKLNIFGIIFGAIIFILSLASLIYMIAKGGIDFNSLVA